MPIYKHTIIALCLLLPAVACDKSDQPKVEVDSAEVAQQEVQEKDPDPKEVLASLDPRVARASELYASIEREPEKSEQLLAQANLDREGLDDLMYEIAIDPDLSSQYRIARGLR